MFSISLDLFCRMSDIKVARPSKRVILTKDGTLCSGRMNYQISYSLHLHFLVLISFVMSIAKSINFDSIGKMQKCSRFFDCKPEPM